MNRSKVNLPVSTRIGFLWDLTPKFARAWFEFSCRFPTHLDETACQTRNTVAHFVRMKLSQELLAGDTHYRGSIVLVQQTQKSARPILKRLSFRQ